MRISTNTFYTESTSTLNQLQTNLAQTNQQIATGKRILNPADDPAAAARVVELSQSDATNTQYGVNRTAATNTLSLSESVLQSATLVLQDAKSLAISAGNGAFSNADRKAIANDLQARYNELLGLANSSDGQGNYLFSGSQGGVMPFVTTATGVTYQGDDVQRKVQASASRQIATTDSGADIFMRVRNGNGTFLSVAASAPVTLSTNATIANSAPGSLVTVPSTNTLVPGMSITGPGFPAGTTVLAVTSATTFTTSAAGTAGAAATIKFGAANTGSGVISAGVVTNPSLYSVNNYQVSFRVAVSTTGSIAPDTAPATGSVVTVADTSKLVAGMPVTGAGFPAGTKILAVTNGTSFTTTQAASPAIAAAGTAVQFGAVYSITDATDPTAPVAVTGQTNQAYVPGQAISFNGIQFDITGLPNNGDVFTVSPSANQSVFTTLSNIITALNTPLAAGSATANAVFNKSLTDALSGLDQSLNNVLSVRATMGSRMREIDSLQNTGDDLGLQYKQTLSQIQDTDYNKAISDFTQQQLTLQAAQKTFSQVSQLSLFNYLR